MKNKLIVSFALLAAAFQAFGMQDDQEIFTQKEKAKLGHAWMTKTSLCTRLQKPLSTCLCGKEVGRRGSHVEFDVIGQSNLNILESVFHSDFSNCSLPQVDVKLKDFVSLKHIDKETWNKLATDFGSRSGTVMYFHGQKVEVAFQEPGLFSLPWITIDDMRVNGSTVDSCLAIKEFNKNNVFFEYWKSKRYFHSIDLIVAKEKGKDHASVYVYAKEPFSFLIKICDIEDDNDIQISNKFLGSLGAIVLPNKGLIYLIAVRSLPEINTNFTDVLIKCQK